MKTLREYLKQYRAEHTQLGTRLTHMVGIPMIVASIPMLPFNPPLSVGMFVGGWALQFVGHYVFEKHNPSFFSDPFYLFVGPIWVAIELAQMLGIQVPIADEIEVETMPGATISVEATPAGNGAQSTF